MCSAPGRPPTPLSLTVRSRVARGSRSPPDTPPCAPSQAIPVPVPRESSWEEVATPVHKTSAGGVRNGLLTLQLPLTDTVLSTYAYLRTRSHTPRRPPSVPFLDFPVSSHSAPEGIGGECRHIRPLPRLCGRASPPHPRHHHRHPIRHPVRQPARDRFRRRTRRAPLHRPIRITGCAAPAAAAVDEEGIA